MSTRWKHYHIHYIQRTSFHHLSSHWCSIRTAISRNPFPHSSLHKVYCAVNSLMLTKVWATSESLSICFRRKGLFFIINSLMFKRSLSVFWSLSHSQYIHSDSVQYEFSYDWKSLITHCNFYPIGKVFLPYEISGVEREPSSTWRFFYILTGIMNLWILMCESSDIK